jgi:hypothetical protein
VGEITVYKESLRLVYYPPGADEDTAPALGVDPALLKRGSGKPYDAWADSTTTAGRGEMRSCDITIT